LKAILNYGTHTAKHVDRFQSEAKESDESEGEDDVQVGDGQFAPRSLFTFKALILDKHGMEIVAPIMKVGSLRDCNIVLHLNIS